VDACAFWPSNTALVTGFRGLLEKMRDGR
jgi:hypothetical protein